MAEYPRAQYFSEFPRCRDCGRRVAGELFDYTNRSIGKFCKGCGERHVRNAHRKHKQFMPDAVIESGWQG